MAEHIYEINIFRLAFLRNDSSCYSGSKYARDLQRSARRPYFLWNSHWSQQGLISWSISEIEERTNMTLYLKSCSTTSHRTGRMLRIHVLLKNLSGVHLSMVGGCNLRIACKGSRKAKVTNALAWNSQWHGVQETSRFASVPETLLLSDMQ